MCTRWMDTRVDEQHLVFQALIAGYPQSVARGGNQRDTVGVTADQLGEQRAQPLGHPKPVLARDRPGAAAGRGGLAGRADCAQLGGQTGQAEVRDVLRDLEEMTLVVDHAAHPGFDAEPRTWQMRGAGRLRPSIQSQTAGLPDNDKGPAEAGPQERQTARGTGLHHPVHAAHAARHRGGPFSGISATIASVVRMFFPIEAALWSAERVTMAGSITPALTRSTTSPLFVQALVLALRCAPR